MPYSLRHTSGVTTSSPAPPAKIRLNFSKYRTAAPKPDLTKPVEDSSDTSGYTEDFLNMYISDSPKKSSTSSDQSSESAKDRDMYDGVSEDTLSEVKDEYDGKEMAEKLIRAKYALVTMQQILLRSESVTIQLERTISGKDALRVYDPNVVSLLEYVVDTCQAYAKSKQGILCARSQNLHSEDSAALQSDLNAWEENLRAVSELVLTVTFKLNTRIPRELGPVLADLYKALGAFVQGTTIPRDQIMKPVPTLKRRRSTKSTTEPNKKAKTTKAVLVAPSWTSNGPNYGEETLQAAADAAVAHATSGSGGPAPPHQFLLNGAAKGKPRRKPAARKAATKKPVAVKTEQ